MKNLAIVTLLFCSFICAAYSFKCYQCNGPPGKDYTTEQCEKDQTKIDCPANSTCLKGHGTTTAGIETEQRGCQLKAVCEGMKKLCEASDDEKKAVGIKECEVACCVSDGDTPCNGGFTVSINMIMIMFTVLCSLNLF